MPYTYQNELKAVKDYYENDKLQKRFSAIVTGETNAGKTYLLRTARLPIHIDSFDPGGSKCLIYDPTDKKSTKRASLHTKENPEGQIFVDTTFEDEDPFNPSAYAAWKKKTEIRLQIKYFDRFATYCIDSLTTFGEAVMHDVMVNAKGGSRAGEVPQMRKDYNPQKNEIINYVRKLMNLPCDFILTGHLREHRKLLHVDKLTGIEKEEVKYRLHITGQAVITIPLLFDEFYVLLGRGMPPRRELVLDSLGEYIARSRLKRGGLLDTKESPDIKALLKKAKIPWEDKEKLELDE